MLQNSSTQQRVSQFILSLDDHSTLFSFYILCQHHITMLSFLGGEIQEMFWGSISHSDSIYPRTLQTWSVPQWFPQGEAPRLWIACSILSWRPWTTARHHCARCYRRRRRRPGVEGPLAWTTLRSFLYGPSTSGRGAMLTLWMLSKRTGETEPHNDLRISVRNPRKQCKESLWTFKH